MQNDYKHGNDSIEEENDEFGENNEYGNQTKKNFHQATNVN